MAPKARKKRRIEIKTTDENVAVVTVWLRNMADRLDVLLTSDRHHDHMDCNRDMERRHLEEVKEKDGIIIDIGDLFCAMQGVHDRRSSKDALDPELKRGDYLDALVEQAANFYAPYAKNFALLGLGNHETGILKHAETNLTKRLVSKLKLHGSHCVAGG